MLDMPAPSLHEAQRRLALCLLVPSRRMTGIARIASVACILALVAGCVSVHVQPILPFPPAPELTFTAQGPVCLSEPDANQLWQYFDKLKAYQDAIERLTK